MAKQFSVKVLEKAIYARCKTPAPRCPLYKLFAPLPNLRVLGGKTNENWFSCSVILCGTNAEIQDAKPTVFSLTQQTCTLCQKQRG